MRLSHRLRRASGALVVILASIAMIASPASAACSLPEEPYVRTYTIASGSAGYLSGLNFNYGKAEYFDRPAPLGRFSSTDFTTYFYTSAGRWASGPFDSEQQTLRVSHNAPSARRYRISRACNNPN